MQASYFLLPFQILLLVFVEKAYGLDCYQCNSHMEQACGGDVIQFKSEYLKPCSANATACRKIKQQLYYSEDYHDRIIRQCAYVNDPPMSCVDRTGTFRFKTSYCHCNGEGCNTGHSVVSSFSVLSVFTGLSYILIKWL
ncbi:uncharacterized protein LOC121378867 [Gigantopelta aegis]|uniref:uncharacterized protein LOC121378867 n=1 Tax=Gigantopelta aegis TaxID=1735272 RepID=UPI001B88782E|nr:uncharacterized protein LOC121378867 [Gigantopelta aegis]